MMENNSNCKSSLSEIQDMLTDITDQVVSVCNANQIPYFLAYGSCLGAVRHKGFIPWDDDIDLCLRYQDIRKLKKCMIGNPNLFFQDLQTDPEYFQTFSKVRKNGTTSMDPELKSVKMHWGICIDLFPLMEYDRPKIRKTTFLKLNLVHKLARIPYQAKIKSSAGGKTGHFRLLNQKWREKLFFRLMDSIERKGSYLFCPFDDVPGCAVFPKEVFTEGKVVPFGDKFFQIPQGYDEYLKRNYGPDYMEIPAQDSQLRYCHSTSIMDCSRDYTEYL